MTTRQETESIGERIALHAAHLDAATHRLLTDLREFDRAGGWQQQAFKSFTAWLAWRVGWDPITAREHVRVAIKLGGLPQIDDALRRGEVSYSKVRAMTRVATPENEATLLEQARHSTGAQLERICKKYAAVKRHDEAVQPQDDIQRRYISRRDTEDGMVKIEAVLHPEEAALVWAALERVATEKCRERTLAPAPKDSAESLPNSVESEPHSASAESLPHTVKSAHANDSAGSSTSNDLAASAALLKPFDRAEALVALAQDVLRGTRRDRAPTDLVVTVPADVLANQHDDATNIAVIADGTCISATAARRLACDCGVIDVVEDERGTPISIGRKRRTIPASMKRALLRRDHTCRFPGCTARVFLQGHHMEHWADGGETKLRNLVSLCSFHHRYVHEYGFTIVTAHAARDLDSASDLIFLDPRGRPVRDIPERPHIRDAGWPEIFDQNAQLGITSETLPYGWDGLRVDYSLCVDALVVADGLR